MKYILLLLPILFSCTKENQDGPLLMRIKNISGSAFSSSFASGKEFGAIADGDITDYKYFEHIVAYPGANVSINGEATYAGLLYCGTPPMPMLKSGKYTLEIFEDSSVALFFLNARFVKD